ncbi:MAG: PDDEXK nuclease domain-containing protein [Bacteroidia bacterium]
MFDIKTRKLRHEDIGQMDMYRRMFDDLKKPRATCLTIGIILCCRQERNHRQVFGDARQSATVCVNTCLTSPQKAELIAEIERDIAAEQSG